MKQFFTITLAILAFSLCYTWAELPADPVDSYDTMTDDMLEPSDDKRGGSMRNALVRFGKRGGNMRNALVRFGRAGNLRNALVRFGKRVAFESDGGGALANVPRPRFG